MSEGVLAVIGDAMNEMGLDYAFMEHITESGENPPKTYFVGEYQELEETDESGKEETIFILTGFSRDKWIRLEKAKEMIKKYFPASSGRIVTTESGSVAAIFYENSLLFRVEDDDLKKIQINLIIKEWKVEE
ncbi:MAG: hypothetical protein HDQ96_04780 [Lachnospiraceae bacterium]|nr:hypothetical protein [Lachnospiraceae bacterium]